MRCHGADSQDPWCQQHPHMGSCPSNPPRDLNAGHRMSPSCGFTTRVFPGISRRTPYCHNAPEGPRPRCHAEAYREPQSATRRDHQHIEQSSERIERGAKCAEMTTCHFDSYSAVLESYSRALRIVLGARRVVFAGTSSRICRHVESYCRHVESYSQARRVVLIARRVVFSSTSTRRGRALRRIGCASRSRRRRCRRVYHHVESRWMRLERNTSVSQRRWYPHQIDLVRL
jgi:hypothetical protein